MRQPGFFMHGNSKVKQRYFFCFPVPIFYVSFLNQNLYNRIIFVADLKIAIFLLLDFKLHF